jgi:hypothetical protein
MLQALSLLNVLLTSGKNSSILTEYEVVEIQNTDYKLQGNYKSL